MRMRDCTKESRLVAKSDSYIFAIEKNSIPNSLSKFPTSPLCSSEQFHEEYGPDRRLLIISRNKGPISTEQIETYRNSNKWKRIRWGFYSLFWFGWLFSLIFAVFVVSSYPKCFPSNRRWWKDSVFYELWTPSYKDSDGDGIGDIRGIDEKLDDLRRLGIEALFIRPIIKMESSGLGVINHTELASHIGTIEQFSALVNNAHKKGLRILIDFPLVVTSIAQPWFDRSALAAIPENSNYADFYFWRRNIPNSEFISPYKNSTLKYYHVELRPELPVLSWSNQNVSDSIKGALSFWISKGIDGFHFSLIDYLHRTSDGLQPEWNEILKILRVLRTHIDEMKSRASESGANKIFLFTSHEHLSESLKLEIVVKGGLDSVLNTELRKLAVGNKICSHFISTVSECANEILSDLLLFHQSHGQSVWPMWSYGSAFTKRLASRVGGGMAELLILLEMILPGTPMFYYGEEINSKDAANGKYAQRGKIDHKSKHLFLRVLRRLLSLRRRSETLKNGLSYITKPMGQSFAFCRYLAREDDQLLKIYGEIFIYTANFGPKIQRISLNDLPPFHTKLNLDRKGRIIAHSSNSKSPHLMNEMIDLTHKEITLHPGQGIIIRTQGY